MGVRAGNDQPDTEGRSEEPGNAGRRRDHQIALENAELLPDDVPEKNGQLVGTFDDGKGIGHGDAHAPCRIHLAFGDRQGVLLAVLEDDLFAGPETDVDREIRRIFVP